MKLHVLTHLPEDIRRFGPAGLYIVEGFEGWNRIWRLCSILSNHHSPSRDIAIKLCKAERIKHLLSGGFWCDKESKKYVQAGQAARGLFKSDKKLRRRLGWGQPPGSIPGTYTPQIGTIFAILIPQVLQQARLALSLQRNSPPAVRGTDCSAPTPSRHHALLVLVPRIVCYSETLSSRHRETLVRSDRGCFIAHQLCAAVFPQNRCVGCSQIVAGREPHLG